MSEQNMTNRKALRDKWQQKIQAAEKNMPSIMI